MAESDIFYVEWGVNHDGAMEKWLRPLFVKLLAFWSPKFALQKGLEKRLFLPQHLKYRCGPTATVTSLKIIWNKGPEQAL